mmetsp:Transcript_67492/g.106858  ORF Transcript_67492/g.106858 Transcript_67492/m.106858 type:complete len:202 (-) Transcript_67492:889-1494(-)
MCNISIASRSSLKVTKPAWEYTVLRSICSSFAVRGSSKPFSEDCSCRSNNRSTASAFSNSSARFCSTSAFFSWTACSYGCNASWCSILRSAEAPPSMRLAACSARSKASCSSCSPCMSLVSSSVCIATWAVSIVFPGNISLKYLRNALSEQYRGGIPSTITVLLVGRGRVFNHLNRRGKKSSCALYAMRCTTTITYQTVSA